MKFAHGIACGMRYLHHEARQRHSDLAARNCLVGPNNTVKIGDFGKLDEDYDYCYYTEPGEVHLHTFIYSQSQKCTNFKTLSCIECSVSCEVDAARESSSLEC
jgi:serine/threonine protein kinase